MHLHSFSFMIQAARFLLLKSLEIVVEIETNMAPPRKLGSTRKVGEGGICRISTPALVLAIVVLGVSLVAVLANRVSWAALAPPPPLQLKMREAALGGAGAPHTEKGLFTRAECDEVAAAARVHAAAEGSGPAVTVSAAAAAAAAENLNSEQRIATQWRLCAQGTATPCDSPRLHAAHARARDRVLEAVRRAHKK
jgi:hypothetical protein